MKENIIKNKFSWKVAGAAGDGILNAGLHMFAKSFLRGGLFVYATAEYPSLIRGGHNHLDVCISDRKLGAHTKYINLLVALNAESIEKHGTKMASGGGIIYDGDEIKISEENILRNDIKLFPVPLLKIANECGGKIMKNTVAIGASMALLDFDMEIFENVIKDNFAKKGESIVQQNIKAARSGYDYIKNNFNIYDFSYKIKKIGERGKIFLSGNEAITIGAIKAGCKFFAAYPMTPASSILSNMAANEKTYNIVVKHTEDEIAAINMAIGASHAGVRAMTATSGGGFSLMVEGFGLAAQTETPLVVVEAQRPGPATGMATHSSQGDLRFVLSASTDEFPRVVVAPGDVDDCFYCTIQAFNLAEKYQMPVLILTDKYLGESYNTTQPFDDSEIIIDRGNLVDEKDVKEGYLRYKNTPSGVSPRAIPSTRGAMFVASSYEHNEEGFEREEPEIRVAMHDKRFRKFEAASKEIKKQKIFGSPDGKISIISWGSTKGPILEAMKILQEKGIDANFMQIIFISPFPKNEVENFIRNAERTLIVENNKTSQLGSIIKEQTGLELDHKILKYDGRPFSPEDIASGIMRILDEVRIKEVIVNGAATTPEKISIPAYR